MQLRQQVFVVEQNCVYLDADGHDPVCLHGLCFLGPTLVAYARILPPRQTYATPSIGRVVVAPVVRGSGLGRVLMEEALSECAARYPTDAISIGAQHHLQTFYESLGFCANGDPYDDDGIMHVDMIRRADSITPRPSP